MGITIGLYYNGARYLAAWLGRWTSADPIGIGADGPGLYNYTRGSPVNYTDPSGTDSISEMGQKALNATGLAPFAEAGASLYREASLKSMMPESNSDTAAVGPTTLPSLGQLVQQQLEHQRTFEPGAFYPRDRPINDEYEEGFGGNSGGLDLRSTGGGGYDSGAVVGGQLTQHEQAYLDQVPGMAATGFAISGGAAFAWALPGWTAAIGAGAAFTQIKHSDDWGGHASAALAAAPAGFMAANKGASAVSVTESLASRSQKTGNPPMIAYGADLNRRQAGVLAQLPEVGSSVIVPKRAFSLKDLAAITAKTNSEFALLTRGAQRMIIRGNELKVPGVNTNTAVEFAEQGWKLSAHSHVGTSWNLASSPGDRAVLGAFGGNQSSIVNSNGMRALFDRTSNIPFPR